MLSKLGEIRRDDGCLDFSGGINEANKDDKIIVYPCHGMKGNQQWIFKEVCIGLCCIPVVFLLYVTDSDHFLDSLMRMKEQETVDYEKIGCIKF